MKTRDEIVAALEGRIERLDKTVNILHDSDTLPKHQMMITGVLEELNTLLKWIRD